MLKQFLNHIETHKLCSTADRILLAVSGGLDSVVMLHLFLEAGYQVTVAHCNFKLRNNESDEDEEFVKRTCAVRKVTYFSRSFETSSYANENGISIQMAARELRYAWFDELLEKEEIPYVATAHHLNDSLETALLNWVHGASLETLTGIPVRNRKVIRPLLFATRNEIESFAREQGIAWREDSSNETDDYSRNFLRHQVIPKLMVLNPSLEIAFQRSVKRIQNEVDLAGAAIEQLHADHVSTQGDQVTIKKSALLNSQNAAYLLWRWTRRLGFNYEVCENVIRGLDGQAGKRFISPSHQLVIDRDKLFISPHVNFWNDTPITADQGTTHLGSWNMDIERLTEIRKSEDPFQATLDTDKVTFPLTWRKWKAGDFFYPLGMEHRKKVSDFLIDAKVPVSSKDTVTVLESSGQIMWVVGYRIDNRFKITDRTVRAISFHVYPHFV